MRRAEEILIFDCIGKVPEGPKCFTYQVDGRAGFFDVFGDKGFQCNAQIFKAVFFHDERKTGSKFE